jgi:hypothetical protein
LTNRKSNNITVFKFRERGEYFVKDRIFNFIIIIITIVIIFGFFAFKIYKNNLRLRESLPYVSVWEKVKKLGIVGIDGKIFNESLLIKK